MSEIGKTLRADKLCQRLREFLNDNDYTNSEMLVIIIPFVLDYIKEVIDEMGVEKENE